MPIPFIDQFLETVKRRRNIRAQSQELKLVKELIRDGKSDDALKKIENLEIRTDLEPIIRIKSKILKIRALIDKEENEKALELIDKVMEELRGKEEPSLMMDTMVSKAKALMELRKYDEGMNTVLEAEELLKTVDHTRIEELAEKKASLSLSKGIVHRRKGELDQALELLQNALSTSEELGTAPKITADALNQIGIIYASKGDFDRALEHLQESLEIYDALGDELAEIRIINNISVILNYKGELDEALRFNQRGLELSEKHGNELISATLLVNTGLIHQNKGELDLALESYEKGLVKYEELGMKREIATCYNLIGNIWFEKGELDKALEYHTKSLALFEEIEDIHETAMSIHNIGNDYRHKGDADKAISYYERSLKLLEEIGNTFDISITLHNLIESSIRWKSVEAAQPYLQKLQEISEKEKDNKAINLIYRVSKAVILRKSDRVVTRAEAQQIFQQIAEEETVIHEHKYGAMLNLCEMLIEELRSSGDEEILDEINAVSKNMLAVAEDQNSFTKLVETYLIQSKMALIELNVDLSKQILGKAQQIAEEKGLQKHAIMISGEYDALLSQLSQWNELIDRNVSLIERLEMVELESMVSRMVRKKEEAPEIPEEEPTLFLILSKSGAIQFSKQFLTEKTLDDQVVSDLLTAINSFIQETFAATGSIERVKHKDHTLVMKPLAESLFCCYAFKGQSYAALHKLEKFIDTAKSKDTLWNVITSGQPLTEEKAVDELITEVFLTPFS